MSAREDLIEAEAAALWRELYDEPPPAQADGCDMLELMLSRLPPVGYDRLTSPFLRPSAVSLPTRRRR